MKSILDVGKDTLFELKRTENPEIIKKLFFERTKEWKYPYVIDESGTIDIFSDLDSISNELGFKLVSEVVGLVLEQTEADLFMTALSLLSSCIELANTTEMPTALKNNWNEINAKVNTMNNKECNLIWEYIIKFYRIR